MENPFFKDEPYVYHAKLIELLACCTIGKDGLLQGETKLKQLIVTKYIFEILLQPDNFTVNDAHKNPELLNELR